MKLPELDNILTKWIDDVVGEFIATLEPSMRTPVKRAWDAYTNTNSSVQSQPISTQCPYLFKKGKRIGQICNTVVKDGNSLFCAKHKMIPQISAKVLELDLTRVEDEPDEEIYLSAGEEKEKDELDVDDDANNDNEEEVEEEAEADDDGDEENYDDGGDDGDGGDDDEF